MKPLRHLILCCIALLLGCCKQPSASFTTDKTEYYQGETVHLTNTSSDGKSFRWTMPDGSTQESVNADFEIDLNDHDATKSFKLNAYASMKSKQSEAIKSVTINQAILESDYFALENVGVLSQHYSPQKKSSFFDYDSKKWLITGYVNLNSGYYSSLILSFLGSDRPAVGIYTVQPNALLLKVDQVVVSINSGRIETDKSYGANSGVVQVLEADNGKQRYTLSNLDASTHGTTDKFLISGDLTVY
jgi:hypothetical protein